MSPEELYNDGKWRILRESASLPDGRKKTIARAYRCDAAHIIALPSPGRVLVLREYRPFYAHWIWMLPSGHVDKENDPLEAAKRELREETGFRADTIRHYFSSQHSESFVSQNHFYIASDLTKDPLPQDEDEMIEVHECSLVEALKNIQASPVIHMASAYGLSRYILEHS